jgi:hypothetical protein
MTVKLTRLTHKIAIQLHLVAESCTIFSSRSSRPVRKIWVHPRLLNPKVTYAFKMGYNVAVKNQTHSRTATLKTDDTKPDSEPVHPPHILIINALRLILVLSCILFGIPRVFFNIAYTFLFSSHPVYVSD